MNEVLNETEIKTLYNNPGIALYKFPAANQTIKATWTALAEKKLTLDANNGLNTMGTRKTSEAFTKPAGTVLTITPPTREGYNFKNWAANTEGKKYISNYQGYNSSTPTGKTFNGTSDFEALGTEYMFEDKITVNLWAYMDDWSDFQGRRMISCAHGGGWDIEPYKAHKTFAFLLHHPNPWINLKNGYMRAHSNHLARHEDVADLQKTITTGARVYYDTPPTTENFVEGTDIVLKDNTWHMFTFTFDGQTLLGYIDGILVAKQIAVSYGKVNYRGYSTNASLGNANDFSNTNGIFVGAEAAANATTPDNGSNYWFKGKLANVSIMHTVIPASEVKELYKGRTRYYFPGADKTVKANWTAKAALPDQTLTINTNGGENTMSTSSFTQTQDTDVEINNPVQKSKTFSHWDESTSKYMSTDQGIVGKKVIVNDSGAEVSRESEAKIIFQGANDLSLDGETYYDLGQTYKYEDRLTVNVWAYMNDWETDFYHKRIISCTQGGGWSFEPSTADKGLLIFQGYDKGIGYKGAMDDSFSYKDITPGWHMLTLTFDGLYLRGYLDGELKAISAPYLSGKLGYHASNSILLGAESYTADKMGDNITPIKCTLRNLAIMNTALTDADIKALYANPADVRAFIPTTHTLKAIWKDNTTAPLTVNANGGTNTMANSATQAWGSSLTVTPPTKDDALFVRWDEPAEQNGLIYHSLNNTNTIQGTKMKVSGTTVTADPDNEGRHIIFNGDEEVIFEKGKGTYYDLGKVFKYPDLFTVNIWAYMDDWATFCSKEDGKIATQMRIFSCTQGGGFGLECNDEQCIQFTGYDAEGCDAKTQQFNGEYSKATSTIPWSSLGTTTDPEASKWHMFTYVYDGNYVRGYLDGQLIATSPRYIGRLKYNENNHLLLGAEASGTDIPDRTTSDHILFEGKMKRLSILHAALTPAQVQELYENPTTTRHYFHEKQPEIKAVWKELPKLAAKKGGKEITTDNAITLHTLLGQSVSTGDIAITSNSIGNTTLSSSAATFKLGNTTVDKDGGNVQVTYTPTKTGTPETTTLQLTADGSSKKEYTITGRAYRFDIAYWNGLGFGVQLDKNDILKECAITVNGDAVKLTEHASEGEDMYFVDLTDKQTLSNQDSKHEADITFTHPSNGVTFTAKIKLPIFPEAGTNKIETVDDDIIITKGRSITQTASDEAVTIGDLYIQPTATLQLAEGATINANSIVFYSDGDAVPQMVLPEGSTFNLSEDDPTIYFVKRVPIGRYYDFSLPYDCNVNEICFADGSGKDKRNIDWEIVYYDGEKRLENNGYSTGWRVFQGDILEAGVGYSIGIAPTLTTKDVVFPMKLTDNKRLTPDYTGTYSQLTKLDNNNKHIPIVAHGAGKEYNHITPNNKGWNFVGNPYLTKYAYQLDQNNEIKEVLKAGKLIVNNIENNGYMYLTIPRVSGTYQYYEQKIYTETTIPPFSAFFIQAGQTGHLKFIPSSRTLQSLAARKVADAQVVKPVYVGVALSSETHKDETSLVIGNQFTQDYEIGSDLEKMLATGNRPQVYVQDAAYKYAFKSLPQADAAGVNPLGVYLPAKGTYTFAIKESYDMTRVQTVYLTDKEKNVTINLLQTPYEFTVDGAKHTAERFYLSVVLAADVTTDMTQTGATTWAVWQDAPLQIRVQGLHIGETLRIFSSTGQMVYEDIMTDTEGIFTLPTAGTYCVQTIGGNATQMKKIMVSM